VAKLMDPTASQVNYAIINRQQLRDFCIQGF